MKKSSQENLSLQMMKKKKKYPFQVYKKFLKNEGRKLSYLVLLDDEPVGCIICSISNIQVTVNTFAVLSYYRGKQFGTKLLQKSMGKIGSMKQITEIVVHVQTNNEGAIRFYEKHGFKKIRIIEKYYLKLSPPSCYLMKKLL